MERLVVSCVPWGSRSSTLSHGRVEGEQDPWELTFRHGHGTAEEASRLTKTLRTSSTTHDPNARFYIGVAGRPDPPVGHQPHFARVLEQQKEQRQERQEPPETKSCSRKKAKPQEREAAALPPRGGLQLIRHSVGQGKLIFVFDFVRFRFVILS